MKKTSAKQAKKIEKRILAVVADLKKAKKARKIEHIEMAEKFLANLTAKLDVAAADLKAKKEKLILAQEAKENAKAQAAEYKEGGKEAKAEEKAADEGKVVFAGCDGNYGNLVIIDHNNGYQTYYAHNSSFNVSVGDVGNDFRCHFRHFLAVLALESVGHEPFSYELFGKLFLFFAFAESFFVAVSIIVT
mgnify:CR=1 FL=1